MQKIEVNQNEYGFDLEFTLVDDSGTALNLTGSTLRLNVQHEDSTAITFYGSMSITDATHGACKYTVTTTNFALSGDHYAEIVVTYPGARVIRFSDILISVAPQLPK